MERSYMKGSESPGVLLSMVKGYARVISAIWLFWGEDREPRIRGAPAIVNAPAAR